MDFSKIIPSKHFEDRTDQSAFEGMLRYMLSPTRKKLENEDIRTAVSDQLRNDPRSINFGAYLSKMFASMSPDELRAMHEGHFNFQDKQFLDALKKFGIDDEMIDPKFRKLYYPNGR